VELIDRLKSLLTGQPQDDSDPAHKERMVKASGVTYANLVCTPETWRKLVMLCTPGGAWSADIGLSRSALSSCSPRDREDGLVQVRLTGPELAEVLYWTGGRTGPMAEDALAHRIYDEVSRTVDRIDLESKDGKRLDDIVIDARLGTE
jgi:hypothetical protein